MDATGCFGTALLCGAVWMALALPTGWLVARWLRWCGGVEPEEGDHA